MKQHNWKNVQEKKNKSGRQTPRKKKFERFLAFWNAREIAALACGRRVGTSLKGCVSRSFFHTFIFALSPRAAKEQEQTAGQVLSKGERGRDG